MSNYDYDNDYEEYYDDYMALSRHKKSDKVKWILTLVAFILVGVMLAGILCVLFIKKDGTMSEDNGTKIEQDGGIVTVPEDDEAAVPVSLSARRLLRAEYEDYGIETYADTAFVIKATYTDASITYKELDWSWAWKDGSSGKWGNGKQTSTYATGSASEDTLTYTVTIHEAFAEQLVVTAKNRVNPEVSKSATFDYARRVTNIADPLYGITTATQEGATVTLSSVNYTSGSGPICSRESGDAASKPVTYTYSSVYTVEDSFKTSITAIGNSAFFDALYDYAATTSYYQEQAFGIQFNAFVAAAKRSFDVSGLNLTLLSALVNGMVNGSALATTNLSKTAAVMAGFYASGSQSYVLELTYTVTGQHSTFTKTVKLGYAANAFGNIASSGSLNFDKAAFVA